MHAHGDDHGNTKGAWTGTIIILLGALIASIGTAQLNLLLGVIGGVLVLVGAIAWVTMEKGATNTTR